MVQKTLTYEHRSGWEPWLSAIVQRIVESCHPYKIILFGSHAYGHPSIDSDIDLLVIMPSRERGLKRQLRVDRLIRPRRFPVDLLVLTPREIQQRLAGFDPFLEEVLTKGRVLYEASR